MFALLINYCPTDRRGYEEPTVLFIKTKDNTEVKFFFYKKNTL